MESLRLDKPFMPSDTSHFIICQQSAAAQCSAWQAWGLMPKCPAYCGYGPAPVIWYLGKTREGKCFLFRFISEMPGPIWVTARFGWYLQKNGSLDFSGANLTAIITPPRSRNSGSTMTTLQRSGIMLSREAFSQPASMHQFQVFDYRGRIVAQHPLSNGKGQEASNRSGHGIYFFVFPEYRDAIRP